MERERGERGRKRGGSEGQRPCIYSGCQPGRCFETLAFPECVLLWASLKKKYGLQGAVHQGR